MWRFEHTETTSAAPERVWEQYVVPAAWPTWDHEIEHVAFEGPLTVGAKGRLKPKGAPTTTFTVTEVEPGQRLTHVTRLPLARLEFHYRVLPQGSGSRLTHSVMVAGPLSPLFSRIIGRGVAAEMPGAMRELVRLAER